MPKPTRHLKRIDIDPKKMTYKDGKMHIPTKYGYDVNVDFEFSIALDPTEFKSGTPVFSINPNLKKAVVVANKDAIPDTELIKQLKKVPVVPDEWKWQDFLVGFIYSNPQDPDNHKWFLQVRRNKQIFSSVPILGVDIDCPVSTFSWHDGFPGGIYHGRFLIDKKDMIEIKEEKWGFIKIIGKQPEGVDGDTSMIPEGVKFVRLRFNIKTDFWYIDWLDSKEKEVGKPVEFRSFVSTCPMKGIADYSKTKPWVSMRIKVDDIGQIQKMGEYVVINRKKKLIY